MNSLVIQPASTRGFTMLEILVVVVIVAIMFTFTALSIRTTSPDELLQTEARKLDRLIQLALDESILRGVEYGIKFSTNGYQFLGSVDGGYNWQVMQSDKMLRARELPNDMEIELAVEETDIVIEDRSKPKDNDDNEDDKKNKKNKKKVRPQIFLLSSGEITPEFTARLVLPGVATSYIVKGTFDGNHSAEISGL